MMLFAGQRWLDASDSPRSSCVDQVVQDAEILRSEQLDVNQDGIKDDVVVYGQDNIYVLVVINQTTSDCKVILNDRLASRQLRSGDRRTAAIRQVELVDLTEDNRPELHVWLELRSDDYRTSDAFHKLYQLRDGTMKTVFVTSQCLEMSSFEFRTAPDGTKLIYLDEDRRCDLPSSSRNYEIYQWSTTKSQFERIESGQIAKSTPDPFWSALLVVYVLPVTAIIMGVVIGLIIWLRSKKKRT
jgi:hypothetical protein